MRTLAEQALRDTAVVSDDVIGTIKAIIAEIDQKLTEQVNLIIHHERFQQVEGAWRGLSYLVNNTETDETLKIKVFNVSKKELGRTLKKFRGTAWDQSPLFKRVYEEEYGQFGGEPFGLLVGEHYFDHSPQDTQDELPIGSDRSNAIWVLKPLPLRPMTSLPWTSSHARTQRSHKMQASWSTAMTGLDRSTPRPEPHGSPGAPSAPWSSADTP